jgi:hypothetical protein
MSTEPNQQTAEYESAIAKGQVLYAYDLYSCGKSA